MMTRDREHEQEDERRRRNAAGAEQIAGKHALTDGLVSASAVRIDSGLGGTISRELASPEPGGLDAPTTELVQGAQGSPSHALPSELRGELEESTGASLGDVRVHTGSASAHAASAVSASAYTLGNDVHFAEGKYSPDTPQGRGLIAHEVAHVVQSGGQSVATDQISLSSPGDAHEVEAHAFGHAFGSGTPTARPTERAAGVGRAIISRGEEDDNPVTPTNAPPKASAGVSGKISSKGVTISPTGSVSHTVKGACLEATASLIVTGTGTLSWPDILDGKGSVEGGAGATKSTDGSSKREDAGKVSKDFTVYEQKVNENAADPQTHKPWIEGLAIKKVVLTASAGGGSENTKDAAGAKKSANTGKVGLKAVATLENGMTVTGDATIVSVKSDPPDISGPNLTGTVALPPLETNTWDLGEGWSAKASLSGSASLSIKPDWKALAQEAGKLVMEMGVAGAIEMAATMAVIAAPILCMVSAVSMIQDETELFHWLRKEAKEAQSAAVALAGGMTMAGSFERNERDAKAYAEGQRVAQAAMASVGLDAEAYALAWKQNAGRRTAVIDQCWSSARAAYDAALDKRAREVYNNSWSEKFWKTEMDFLQTWRQKGYEAWPAG